MREKLDLNEELVPGVKFRAVRDAVRKMGPHSFALDYLSSYLFAPNIQEAILNNAKVGEDVSYWVQLRHVRNLWDRSDIRDGSPHYEARWSTILKHCRQLRARIPEIKQALLERDIITPDGHDEGYYELSDAGRSLAAQKALRRISRERGQALLEKAISAAVAYNEQPNLTYRVGKLYLFGSLLTDRSDVGDVDLIAIVERVYREGESREDFRRRDERLAKELGVPAFLMGMRTCEREPRKHLQKISPYLSVANEETLRTMQERGEPTKLVYEHPKDLPR